MNDGIDIISKIKINKKQVQNFLKWIKYTNTNTLPGRKAKINCSPTDFFTSKKKRPTIQHTGSVNNTKKSARVELLIN
jgi:hypothetical protein